MINIHLGMPRIGFRNLDFFESGTKPHTKEAVHLLPASFYKGSLRSTVNSSRRRRNLIDSSRAHEAVQSLFQFENLSISQPALLGEPRQLILSQRARRKAANRIQVLRELFYGRRVQFHLLVTNPAEYLHLIMPAEADELLKSYAPFSWTGFIDDLGLTSSNSYLTVWNCHHRSTVLQKFLAVFMNKSKSEAAVAYQASLAHQFPDLPDNSELFSEDFEWQAEEHMVSFEEDLAELRRRPRVSVVGQRGT